MQRMARLVLILVLMMLAFSTMLAAEVWPMPSTFDPTLSEEGFFGLTFPLEETTELLTLGLILDVFLADHLGQKMITIIPEPSGLAGLAGGIVWLGMSVRRKKK